MKTICPPDHSASRLTDHDVDAMRTRVVETIALWRRADGSPTRRLHIGPDSLMALYRVAASAVGCSDADLRDSELLIRDAVVHMVVGELPA